MPAPAQVLPSSLRDAAGSVFWESGTVKRGITVYGQEDYNLLMRSGLYDDLARRGLLLTHREEIPAAGSRFCKVLVPQQIPLITYPYEWCFSQLKEAALLTLEIQALAMEYGMGLKDATPFNVQFLDGKPIFIDTLSFEKWADAPWVAYRQFCESFLAPLFLMAYLHPGFNKYLTVDLNGLDLSLASRVLPARTWFHPGCLLHIHLHALSQRRWGKSAGRPVRASLPRRRVQSLVESLRSCVESLKFGRWDTPFTDYQKDCRHYSPEAQAFKADWVLARVRKACPRWVLDLGANIGFLSRIVTRLGIRCVALDSDASCVEENYRRSRQEGDRCMIPLLADPCNPPPNLGWMGTERTALFDRLKPDAVMALAMLHHLRITHTIAMEGIAQFLSEIGPTLLIEFVPKEDPMVQEMLRNRSDEFHDYTLGDFERCFGRFFAIEEKSPIPGTSRILYHLVRKKDAWNGSPL